VPEPYHGRRLRTAAIALGAAALLLASCGSKKRPKDERKDAGVSQLADEPAEPLCAPAPFAATIDVAEASGAVLFDGLGLVVASDSDHHGAYQIVEPTTGELVSASRLPLSEETSDDIEGLSAVGKTLVAITSTGMIYEFTHNGSAFEATNSPYPVGDAQAGCPHRSTNCGYNWEGLCLGPPSVPALRGCAGAAVSKRDGTLVCLTRSESGQLAIDPTRTLAAGRRETLSGCAIDGAGGIWVATNLLAANAVTMFAESHEQLYKTWAVGSIEAIAVLSWSDRASEIVLLSDTARAPSAAFRYRCTTEL